MQKDIKSWLVLSLASGLGPIKIKKLLASFYTPQKILDAPIEALKKFKLSEKTIQELKHPNVRLIEATLNWCAKPGHTLLTQQDPDYPAILKEIPAAPLLLYVNGSAKLLNQMQIAIVGSRNPTSIGGAIAKAFAIELSQLGFVVTSGLALGIDAQCHLGSVETNQPTIAVQGCGLMQIYPKQHTALARDIIATGGAIISEFPLHAQPMRANFPIRNRIISGLSVATLVIEASLNSGSLITARMAAEFGREVFAVPGSIHSPLSRGCHFLIKEGAKLTESIEDILSEIKPLLHAHSVCKVVSAKKNEPREDAREDKAIGKLDKYCTTLLKYINNNPISINQLVAMSGFDAAQISTLLILLELNGYICPTISGYVRI